MPSLNVPLKRKLKLAWMLGREAGWPVAAKWLAATLSGKRTLLDATIGGVPVTLRSGTTDVDVALTSLRGEFDELVAAVPDLRHGLIVDAGGYIGTAAIVFAKAYPEATVVTLEPSDENFALLSRNVAAWPNIKPLKVALSSTAESVELRDRGTGHWGLTIVENAEDNAAAVIGQVECLTVRDVLDRFGRPGIDILKLDIEGGEHKLLSANTEWVADTGAICIELHDRIVDGCSRVYEAATVNRANSKLAGEKYLSLNV